MDVDRSMRVQSRFELILTMLACSAFWSVAAIAATPVRVIGVHDGDTIRVVAKNKEIKIRLHGIDAPEKGQAFGQLATKGLRSLLAGRKVSIEPMDTDRYGRTVAMIYADGLNINQALVANGWAWVFPKYCTQSFCAAWKTAEHLAKIEQKALWDNPAPVPPWEWRANRRKIRSTVRGTHRPGAGELGR
jgi:endonuclease YncB( thermonuclease family)